MIKKAKYIFFLLIFGFLGLGAHAQIQISVTKNQKEVYKAGDQIEVQINLKTLPQTCAEGMERTKVYVSGMEILTQTDWMKTNNSIWTKKVTLKFIETSKKEAKITVMRKVDKESLFKQQKFAIFN